MRCYEDFKMKPNTELNRIKDDLKVMYDYSNIFLEEMWCEDEQCWSEII